MTLVNVKLEVSGYKRIIDYLKIVDLIGPIHF